MSKSLFSLAEVAERFNVPQSDIRALISDGVISVPQVAGRFVFDDERIDEVAEALDEADMGSDESEESGADDESIDEEGEGAEDD